MVVSPPSYKVLLYSHVYVHVGVQDTGKRPLSMSQEFCCQSEKTPTDLNGPMVWLGIRQYHPYNLPRTFFLVCFYILPLSLTKALISDSHLLTYVCRLVLNFTLVRVPGLFWGLPLCCAVYYSYCLIEVKMICNFTSTIIINHPCCVPDSDWIVRDLLRRLRTQAEQEMFIQIRELQLGRGGG